MDRLRREFELRARMIKVRTRGRVGEEMAGLLFPRETRDQVEIDRRCFETPFGLRRIDNFMAETSEAVESKMTRVTTGSRIRKQITKDGWLLRQGLVKRVIWILYKGASAQAKALLAGQGIEIVDGWENLTPADSTKY